MNRNEEKSGKLSALEPKTLEKRSWERILKAQYLIRPATISWTLNILLGFGILFIISTPRSTVVQNVYTLPAKDGEPVIAVRDLKIPQDLEVPDLEGTQKKRAEAEARTQSIYDWDPLVLENIKKEVAVFFGGFRELYPPTPETPEGTAPAPESAPITVPASFLSEKEQELLRSFSVSLTPEDLDILKSRNFEAQLEQDVTAIISAVYTGEGGAHVYLVPNKELLLKEKDKGIVARRINAPPEEAPLEIKNLEPILDIIAGQQIIEKSVKEKDKKTPRELKTVIINITTGLLDPNLTFNKDKTEEAKAVAVAAAKPLYYKFKKDEIIVRKGDRLPPDTIIKINAILQAQETHGPSSLIKSGGLLIMILFMIAFLVSFSKKNIRKFSLEPKDMVFLSTVLLLSLVVLKGLDLISRAALDNLSGVPEGLNFYYLIPLAGAVMLVRMVLNSEIALVFSIALLILGGMVADNSLLFGIYTMVGSVVAAGEVQQCRQRTTILRAGLVLGLVNMLLVLIISMVTNQFLPLGSFPTTPIVNALFGLAGGIFVAILVTGLVPLAEYLFSYATDIKLLELLNQDHPLLKELSMRAPGTHQHSLMVGNLAEEASKSIGANPLLARVCAMYHDLGKMNKPQYYAENQWDEENVHERLTPSMSTLVIHKHVKDGVEMAEKHKLPKVVIEALQQHHGTGLLKFFFEKARELDDTGVPVEEVDFRYPGPKPQTREAAIIMLADVAESAARTVRDPNPARLQGMVQKLINRFFIDGQLDECDLTLKDLHDIARSFNTTLGAIYHHRPDYPQPVVKGGDPEKKKKAEQDAAKSKDKGQAQKQDQSEEDKEESENYLRRLGM